MSKVYNHFLAYLLLSIIVTVFGCSQNEVEYLIEEEVIVKILVDVHIAEAAAQQGNISQRDSLRNTYYNQVFKVHGVSKKRYEEDMELLKRDAQKLGRIYDKVIDQLKQRKKDL